MRRNSKQRQVILEELLKATSHPTADELFALVRRRLPRISLGTVYRNLDVLCRWGKVARLQTGGGQYRFDGNSTSHYHVFCLKCGRADDVAGPSVHIDPAQFRGLEAYEVTGYRLFFVGACSQCREKRKVSAKNMVE